MSSQRFDFDLTNDQLLRFECLEYAMALSRRPRQGLLGNNAYSYQVAAPAPVDATPLEVLETAQRLYNFILGGESSETSEVYFHDEYSGRYFNAPADALQRALSEINLQIAEHGSASLNDFYDHLGLDIIPVGDEVGWTGLRVEERPGSVLNRLTGMPAKSFRLYPQPKNSDGRLA